MDRPLKKTETIEIRIPHETKQAFMARCREDGVSASEALRGCIGERLEVRPARVVSAKAPAAVWRRRLQRGAGLAVAVGVAATALPSLAGSADRVGFAQLDADGSGGVSRSELAQGSSLQVRLEAGGSGVEIGRVRATASDATEALFQSLLNTQFTAMDADGNGSVSFREFRKR